MLTRHSAAAVLFAVVAGCGDGSTDPSPAAVYALEQLNDSTLPYDHEGLGCCSYLSGGIELTDGDYAISLTARNRRNTGVIYGQGMGELHRQRVIAQFRLGQFCGDRLPPRLGGAVRRFAAGGVWGRGARGAGSVPRALRACSLTRRGFGGKPRNSIEALCQATRADL